MNTIFLNSQLLEKFYQKAQTIAAAWNYPKDQFFQVYTMVATIELGFTEKCFYHKNGIVYEGWNGYRHTAADHNDPNPYSAYQGFYRMERNQMVGWSCWMIYNAADKVGQASHCGRVYGHWFEWEPEPKVWGFLSFQDYYTEAEAADALQPLKEQKHVKRYSIEYSDMSGCYRLRLETVKKKTHLRDCWKARITI